MWEVAQVEHVNAARPVHCIDEIRNPEAYAKTGGLSHKSLVIRTLKFACTGVEVETRFQ